MLSTLSKTPWGWRGFIPGFQFLHQPLSLEITTRDVPAEESPPTLNENEKTLARLVLSGLGEVLFAAEQAYHTYHLAVPQAIELAYDPRIWICRTGLNRDGLDRWQFVVGIMGAEDYGTHVEFAGLSCLGIWSGD